MKTRNRISLAFVCPIAAMAVSPTALAGTDYNDDGRDDIAFHRPGGTWNSVPVLLGGGSGPWASANAAVPSWANQPDVVALPGDYNGDGRTDVAFHRPGSGWSSVPVLFGSGNGSWTSTNFAAPGWANQPGVIAMPGDYDGNGRTDIAFHRPGSTWTVVPVLFSNGNGSWNATSQAAPSWANQPGAVALPGDFDGNGRADIAFHRPGSTWSTVPVLLSNGNGTWASANAPAPGWANQPGVIGLTGSYDGNGRTDIAFHRPGSTWSTVPVLFSAGNGTWTSSNVGAPSWANQAGAVALTGDYDGDSRTDIAFHRPGSTWNSAPVLRSNGAGGWSSTNFLVPAWVNQAGAIAVPGDYDGDGRADLAFHRRDTSSTSVPVLFGNAVGGWSSSARLAPSWANQPGVVAVRGYRPRYDPLQNIQDGGDVAYDQTATAASTFRAGFDALALSLRWPNPGGPIVILPTYDNYIALQDALGLTGAYDGTITNGLSTTRVYASLKDFQGEAHGTVRALEPTLRFQDGFCGDLSVPLTTLPVNMVSTGPFYPAPITQRSSFEASGSTTREVSILGLFSGEMVIDFDVTLHNIAPGLMESWLFGTIHLDVPWPCRDQSLSIQLERRNHILYQAFNYP